MIANMPLSGEVITACEQLKFIDVAFTGVDHVDLSAAKAKGIKVSIIHFICPPIVAKKFTN